MKKRKLSAIDVIAHEFFGKIICDRCGKETDKWSGTPEFRICKDCFNELQEQMEN